MLDLLLGGLNVLKNGCQIVNHTSPTSVHSTKDIRPTPHQRKIDIGRPHTVLSDEAIVTEQGSSQIKNNMVSTSFFDSKESSGRLGLMGSRG